MTPSARLAAAAEVLAEIFARKAAADRTLAAWGKAHRFAGSKDRAAVTERVYAVLRRRNECAHAMDDDSPRALVLGSLAVIDELKLPVIEALASGGPHALGQLTAEERNALEAPRRTSDPWIALNYPQWLHEEMMQAFGAKLEREMKALNGRASLDLRVNTLKADRAAVIAELSADGMMVVPLPAPTAIRLANANAKVTATSAYREGRVEIQDQSSQRAVAFAAPKFGDTVIDLAAGAGGKSLALAAAIANEGRVLACDVEPGRLRNMELRVARAGATSIEIVGDPYGGAIAAEACRRCDLIFVDAPCSGSGTWRRNPETKWTLDEVRLAAYRVAQTKLLDRATELAGPDTRIAYAVCSILKPEGEELVRAFAARRPDWKLSATQTLTPANDDTDGFFIANLDRTRR